MKTRIYPCLVIRRAPRPMIPRHFGAGAVDRAGKTRAYATISSSDAAGTQKRQRTRPDAAEKDQDECLIQRLYSFRDSV